MDNAALREKLLEIVLKKSVKYNPDQPFTLASGRKSPYYFDLRQTTLDAEGMCLAGQLFFNSSAGANIEAVGGMGIGAMPLVIATTLTSFQQGHPWQAFLVRKDVKAHGMQREVEGNIRPGLRAVILEDVLTSGNSALMSAKKAQAAGLDVQSVLVLLDREEGGKATLMEHNLPCQAIFTKTEILEAHRSIIHKG